MAFDDSTMSRFGEGRKDVNDDSPSGRPSTSTTDENITTVTKMILNNRRSTIREFADDVETWGSGDLRLWSKNNVAPTSLRRCW